MVYNNCRVLVNISEIPYTLSHRDRLFYRSTIVPTVIDDRPLYPREWGTVRQTACVLVSCSLSHGPLSIVCRHRQKYCSLLIIPLKQSVATRKSVTILRGKREWYIT